MSSTNFENSDPAQNSSVSRDFVPSFELTLKLIMALKSNYLRETFLIYLGKGEDKFRLLFAAGLSVKFLLKQKEEDDEFNERVKKGEITYGELVKFREEQINAIYCPICWGKIKKDDKVFQCRCTIIFHEKCFREENDSEDKCVACRNFFSLD